MNALALDVRTDGLLQIVAPLGLGAAAGTALVIDLAGHLRSTGGTSLTDLLEEGPRRSDLHPQRAGLAVLPRGTGPVTDTQKDCQELLRALANGWPAVVLTSPAESLSIPTVSVWPVLPDPYGPPPDAEGVFQATGLASAPRRSLGLPVPSRACIAGLLAGVVPARSRWIRAWRPVWRLAWQ